MAKPRVPIRSQDVDAHKFWDVDWSDWLVKRGFLADGSEITGFTVDVDASATKTFEQQLAGTPIIRVWVKDVPLGVEIKVKVTIQLPEPDPGAGPVTDDFVFKLKGVDA